LHHFTVAHLDRYRNLQRRILPVTPFDNTLDRKSINPRFQAFEKFVSGMYLGEITRNILLHLTDAFPPILFRGLSTPQLNAHYGFDAAFMSDVENARTSKEIRNNLVGHLGFKPEIISDEDTDVVRWACQMVATRAAKLSGAAVAAVLVQTGNARIGGGFSDGTETLKVGVDGRWHAFLLCGNLQPLIWKISLIQFYPGFEQRMRESLRAIVGLEIEKRVEIGLAKDGSGVGGLSRSCLDDSCAENCSWSSCPLCITRSETCRMNVLQLYYFIEWTMYRSERSYALKE
jgi:hexokinase